MQVQLEQIIVPPGTIWKNGVPGLTTGGVLEIMVPLPEHEDDKVIIADFVKVLLEELDLEFRSLGSTTFKSETMKRGIEADDCFYIENEAAIRGKKRIDLTIDPPPDIALEIDITSRTRFDNYEVLGVKELWRFNGKQLEINILRSGSYVQVDESPHFPGFLLSEVIPQYLERSKIEGRNKTMKAFRVWVKSRLAVTE